MSAKPKKEDKSWQDYQDEMANEKGLAVVLVDRKGLSAISKSNNNSICEVLVNSKKFAPECAKYCGKVFTKVAENKKPLKYKCHAGLECVAVPIKDKTGKQYVAITGRAFVQSKDYRNATEKAISGEWQQFPSTSFFENVLLAGSKQNIEELGKEVTNLTDDAKRALSKVAKVSGKREPEKKEVPQIEKVQPSKSNGEGKSTKLLQDIRIDSLTKTKSGDKADVSSLAASDSIDSGSVKPKVSSKLDKAAKREKPKATRAKKTTTIGAKEKLAIKEVFDSIRGLKYKDACLFVLHFTRKHYGIESVAWLENRNNNLIKTLALGGLQGQKIRISLKTDDQRLLRLFRKESSIELRERNGKKGRKQMQTIRLFPLVSGNEIRSALAIAQESQTSDLNKRISRFCRMIALELELLRLREEIVRRSALDVALQRFSESLKMIDTEDFWIRLMRHTAELMQAERGSILVYDEIENNLAIKALVGRKADIIRGGKQKVGGRIANDVWKSGKPLVVPSISKTNVSPAPADWSYNTESFICYPIKIGERKIGVLNIADRIDGGSYQEFDLQLLGVIVPQIAMAIDHAILKNKAGKFEQLSVTDSLTGLLNRRYLKERLTEEIKRSNRHGYAMSFMMIDVDNFKSYNDSFTHPEGDKALKLVAKGIRDSLRGADVASRYGGEEFSILLPQTSLDEAIAIAERIREKISAIEFPNRQVTVSVGVRGMLTSEDTADQIISDADKALFEAKGAGRNRVHVYQPPKRKI